MICTRDIPSGEQIVSSSHALILLLAHLHQWNTYGDPPNSDLLRRYGHVDIIPLGNGVQGNPADVVDIRADAVLDVFRSQTQNDKESLLERIDWWLEEGGDELRFCSHITEMVLNIIAACLLWKQIMHCPRSLFPLSVSC